ncbi:MAG: hypothetical protein ACK5MT_18755 [Actinomycetales bacterium]
MTSSRRLRAARGIGAATCATALALFSHLLGGGQVPHWLGVVVPWMLSAPVCVALAGRRVGLLRLSASVGISQLLFHLLFVLGSQAPAVTGSTMTAAPHGHLHAVGATGAANAAVLAPPGGSGHADPAMWCWHAVAAVLTIAAVYRGERALSRLREFTSWLCRWWLPALVCALVLVPDPVAPSPTWSSRSRWTPPELTVQRRRGPPICALPGQYALAV